MTLDEILSADRSAGISQESPSVSIVRPLHRVLWHARMSVCKWRLGKSLTGVSSWTASDETFEADPATEQMLLTAIARCERGDTTLMTQLLSELRSRE